MQAIILQFFVSKTFFRMGEREGGGVAKLQNLEHFGFHLAQKLSSVTEKYFGLFIF